MHREEEEGIDATAGVSLIRVLGSYGFSTKVLIYTNNLAMAKKKAVEVNATPTELEMITNSSQSVLDFCSNWAND